MAAWVNDNVHGWSGQMSAVLRAEMPQLVSESEVAAGRFVDGLVKRTLKPALWAVVDKIASRRQNKDQDLCGVNPLGMLQIAWEETPRDADGDKALSDLLADIGHTCLQGDTHRLFFYIRAVRMSKTK